MSNSPQLTYYSFSPKVVAFSTTRHGGVSQGAYGAFNINSYCGDDVEAVAANQSLLCRQLGIVPEALVVPHQTHGDVVRQIGQEWLSLPAHQRSRLLEGVDAVMTDVPQLCIGVSTADCIPVLLYDAEHHAGCAVHAGWRGTVKRIVGKAVAAMQQTYHTEPSQLRACIAPGISLDSFEVGDEVYDEFAKAGFDMPLISVRRAKWHLDLPVCNLLQLKAAGVPEESVYLSGICTYQQHCDYFSARRSGIHSGRIYTAIMLK